jgi:DNA-directed RNA polymerase specialized sigma24 family protein
MDDAYQLATGEARTPRRVHSRSATITGARVGRVWQAFCAERSDLVVLARRRLIDATLAEDAVHDALEQTINYCVTRGIEDRAAIVAALQRSVGWRSGELNRVTRTSRRRHAQVASQHSVVCVRETAAEATEAADLSAAIVDVLARLSDSDRLAVRLRTIDNLPYASVAAQIGGNARQAKRAVEGALGRVRALYVARAEGQLCQAASELLPLLSAGTLDELLDVEEARLVRVHSEGCLRCRMEQRFYRRSVMQATSMVAARPRTTQVTSGG